jgi:hypothetical protein
MNFFLWLKRMPWRKKQAGVFFRSGGGKLVCLPACCRERRRVLDLTQPPAYSPPDNGFRSVYFRFEVVTRRLGPPRKLLEILNQINCTGSVNTLPEKPANGLIARLRTILRKTANRR